MKKLNLGFVLLLLFILACSEDSPTEQKKSVYIDGQTYRNEIIGFEFTAPEGWELKLNQSVAGITTLLVGNKMNYSGIPPSFNLITENANDMKSASELLVASESYITNSFSEVEFTSKEIRSINGIMCAELIYVFEYEGVKLQQHQVLFLCGEKLSVALTFTASLQSYYDIRNEFDAIINSLKFI